MKRIPKTKEDFAWVNWEAKEIQGAGNKAIADKKKAYQQIKKIPAIARTFENTIQALDQAESDFGEVVGQINLLMNVRSEKKIRDTANMAETKAIGQSIELIYDRGLYRAILEYVAQKEKLLAVDRKLLDDTIRDFKRMGFNLSKSKFEKVISLAKEIQKLEKQFDQNLNEYNDSITITEKEIGGLPEEYLSSLQKNKSADYIISLKPPEMISFMENSSLAGKRKLLYDKNLRKGDVKNLVLARKIVNLRQKRARLLGYQNHADYVIEPQMAKTATAVDKFLEGLLLKLQSRGKADLRQLAEYKKRIDNKNTGPLKYYDIAYYAKKLEQELFGFDSEKLREYFPLDRVLNHIFNLYRRVFSVSTEKMTKYPLWDKSVLHYIVKDKTGVLGHFILDLFPRDGKSGHFMVCPTKSTRVKDGKRIIPVSVMVANFRVARPDSPCLLSYEDMRTMYHEFGHIFHSMLSMAVYGSHAGTSVARDFVETPSQMMENWPRQKDMIREISGHYRTGEKLSNRTIDQLLASTKFFSGYMYTRQAILSLYDLNLHQAGSSKLRSYNFLMKKYLGLELPRANLFPAGFWHFSGYDVGYYGYLWSKVYAIDLFTRFKKEGILNLKVGKEYRDKVLAVGGSRDEMESVKDFLGRKPNNKAFLEEIGIKE